MRPRQTGPEREHKEKQEHKIGKQRTSSLGGSHRCPDSAGQVMSASVTTDSGEVQTTGSGLAGPHSGLQTSGLGRAGREHVMSVGTLV